VVVLLWLGVGAKHVNDLRGALQDSERTTHNFAERSTFSSNTIAKLWVVRSESCSAPRRSLTCLAPTLQDSERTTHNFAMVFEENVLRSIGEIDKALLYMRPTLVARITPSRPMIATCTMISLRRSVVLTIVPKDKALLYMRRSIESRAGREDFGTIVNTTDLLSEIIVQVGHWSPASRRRAR
jgi:hypothetical protein